MLHKIKYSLFVCLTMGLAFPMTTHARMKATPVEDELNAGLIKFMKEYRVALTGIVAFGVMTGLLAFIFLLTKLAAAADNPKERGEILKELAMVGVTTSLLGSFWFIVNIYYSIMMN